MELFGKKISTPLGKMTLVANEKSLKAILWQNEKSKKFRKDELNFAAPNQVLKQAEKQIGEYFAGKRKQFDLPLDLDGTEFQKKVWKALTTISFGKTASYADIARKVKSPKAFRAVGAANRVNPICIIVPCHRIIGAQGDLVGFAGGLKAKSFLLNLEKSN